MTKIEKLLAGILKELRVQNADIKLNRERYKMFAKEMLLQLVRMGTISRELAGEILSKI